MEDYENARKLKFRGLPTLFIDGRDLEDQFVPEKPTVTCRYFPKGLPATSDIIDNINNIYKKLFF